MPPFPNQRRQMRGYRKGLRGLPPEELQKLLAQFGEGTDPLAQRKQQILERRIALAKNPGVRKEMPDRIGKIRDLVGEEDRDPQEQRRLELLRARRDTQLFNRPQAVVRPDSVQTPPDVAPTAPPAQRPELRSQIGKLPGQNNLRAELVRRRRPRRQQLRQPYRGGY